MTVLVFPSGEFDPCKDNITGADHDTMNHAATGPVVKDRKGGRKARSEGTSKSHRREDQTGALCNSWAGAPQMRWETRKLEGQEHPRTEDGHELTCRHCRHRMLWTAYMNRLRQDTLTSFRSCLPQGFHPRSTSVHISTRCPTALRCAAGWLGRCSVLALRPVPPPGKDLLRTNPTLHVAPEEC